MNRENTEKLAERFPHLWHKLFGDPVETSMAWGFTCGDGWFQLIWDLCLKIDEELKKETSPQFIVRQVKEKFGTLRFYVDGESASDRIYELIQDAEERSATTCEMCGVPRSKVSYDVRPVVNRCIRCQKTKAIMVKSGIPEELLLKYQKVLYRYEGLFKSLAE